jgi:hypothetical protein
MAARPSHVYARRLAKPALEVAAGPLGRGGFGTVGAGAGRGHLLSTAAGGLKLAWTRAVLAFCTGIDRHS